MKTVPACAMAMRKMLILSICFYFVSSGIAQNLTNIPTDNPLKTKLDSVIHQRISEVMIDSIITGMSFGISVNNERFFYNYGNTEKGEQKLPNQNTIYEIGSLTKTFTGIILAKAVLEDKINMEDDIRKFLGANYDNLNYDGKPIKVINLANHTSGLPEDLIPDEIFRLENPTMFDIINIFEGDSGTIFRKDLQKVKPDTPPGTKWRYSNVGMITLGMILENVYQMSYSDLIKEYFSEPFNMMNTEAVYCQTDTTGYTKGYDKNGNIMPHITFQIAGAAGGLKSTTSDLMKYIEENIHIKDKAIELSHKRTFESDQQSMGLGWNLNTKSKNDVLLWHDGGEPGFSSYILIIPNHNIGIVCLANQSGRQFQFSKFCKLVIDDLIEQ